MLESIIIVRYFSLCKFSFVNEDTGYESINQIFYIRNIASRNIHRNSKKYNVTDIEYPKYIASALNHFS